MPTQSKQPGFTLSRRIASAKVHEFDLITKFPLGYRNREDKTALPAGVLIEGSQNVLTDVTGRVGITKGYALDGAASVVIAPILGSFDWQMHTGDERHLRAGFLTNGTDGKLQYRYVHTDDTVEWRDLITSLSSVSFNFSDYWDSTAFQSRLLFVNGQSRIYSWTGGITTIQSVTSAVAGMVTVVVAHTAGTGYHINDIITLTGGGGTGATFKVNSIGGSGAVSTFTQLTGGSGYSTGMDLATTVAPSGGTGFTLDVTTIITGGTITKQGTTSWTEVGFDNSSAARKITILGVDYIYSGGESTTTLFGVTPDPSAAMPPITTGEVAHQTPRFTLNSAMTGIPSTFANSLIANLKNQIYIGSLVNNQVYVSKVNNYLDYSFTTPVRSIGEGAILTLDGTPIAFVNQEDAMYISAGTDQWYETQFTLSADLTKEDLSIQRLKTTTQQAAQSQALTSKIRNNVVFVSNEPILNSLGRITDVVLTPQMSDLSWPIVNDMNVYDFTDGDVFYYRNYIYVAVPKESLIRVYNMTNSANASSADITNKNFYWEAPVTIPISRFSIIDGDLYGHSYQTSESYKLFTGYNFNGHPIDARAVFSYENQGVPPQSKSFNEFYVEGYISSNATLDLNLNYELDGFGGKQTFPIVGTDTQIVQASTPSGSLGKVSLGKNPIGGSQTISTLPPKFRVIITMARTPFYEYSPSFSSVGTDYNWSILRFGSNGSPTSEGNNPITK